MYGCDGLVLVVCTMDTAPINIEDLKVHRRLLAARFSSTNGLLNIGL